jgi:1-acyl-sn-glycerol-3-phosphate acyltransferase
MTNFFLGLYTWLSTRRWLIVVGILAIFVTCGLALYYSNLEEDITKILPSNAETEKFNEGFLDSELSSRIVLHISTDKTDQADLLTHTCQELVDSLQASNIAELIKDINYKIDPTLLQEVSSGVIANLPLFLQEDDYTELTKRIEEKAIQERTYGAYKAIISPASFAFKDVIRKDPLGLSSLVFESLTNFQLDENFELYDGFILSKDQQNLLFFLNPKLGIAESSANGQLINTLDKITSGINDKYSENLKVSYFGGPAIGLANATRIKKDVSITVGIALLSLFLLIGYFYGNWKIFFYILIPVLIGAAFALAVIGIVKPTLSIIAIGVGSVLIGIGIDFSIHLFTHFRKTQSVTQVIEDVSMPMLLSALTTACAFLCLYFVRSEALHDLGLFAAISVFSCAFFALIILPHFFVPGNTGNRKQTFIEKIAYYPFHKNKWLLYTVLILFIFCTFNASGVKFERDLYNINYMSDELLEAEAKLDNISDVTKRGIYLISSGKNIDEALETNLIILQKLEQLKEEGKIESYVSPNQLISSRKEQQVKIDRWNQFWTEERKERTKASIIRNTETLKFKPEAFAAFFNLLEKKFVTVDPLALDKATGHIVKDYFSTKEGSASSTTMIRLEPDQKTHIHAAFSDLDRVAILDKEYIVQQFVDILKNDFGKLVWISLILVFFILHLVYGRPELAWVAFLPICFSWVITLGLMNVFQIKFNIVNIIITSFIFGLGIDYSIFVMRGLLQKYATGQENLNSYKTSIVLSSMTTLVGIGVLIFAHHPALRSIASISLIGIFSVVLVTFLIQPLIFNWLIEKKGKKRSYPLTFTNILQTLVVYGLLIFGCFVLTIIGLLLTVLFFIPIETRKTFFHYCIYYASKFYIKASSFGKFKQEFKSHIDFSKPSLFLANHKSLIDTPMFFQLTPKIIIITNDWVAKSPLYRSVCKMADFYSISQGADDLLEKLEERVKQGYSIAIFPEGTRSFSEKMLRFKKGSFYLAEQLKLDIVPVFIHGTQPFLSKGNFWGRTNDITVKVYDRILFDEKTFGDNYSAVTKNFSKWFKGEYNNLRKELETVHYHRTEIIHNYLYKGPVTEWYSKVKTKMEDNYAVFDNLISADASICDLGCGYGYMTYFLGKAKPERKFISVDYDQHKIDVAQHCAIRTDNMQFVHADITNYELPESDVFLISDVTHYLTSEEQYRLLDRCFDKLNNNGQIILRDGDGDLKERHKGTKMTEIFSTKSGFNKTKNDLHYLSGKELEKWAHSKGLNLQRLDNTKFTSNVIFVLNNNKK